MEKAELVDVDAFNYTLIDKDQQAKLRYCAGEIQKQKTSVAVSIMAIGEMLTVAQEQLANYHNGTFQKWIESECGFSKATAYNYLAAFRVFKSCPTVGQLEDGAMYALAQKETPEKALTEVLKLTEKGVKITQKQAKQIIEKYRSSSPSPSAPSSSSLSVEPPPPAKPQPTKEELLKLELKKARSYTEVLVRAIDDVNRVKRNTVIHPQLLNLCFQILEGLDRW